MNKMLKRILWILLAVSILLSFNGIFLRISNERNNRAVVPVIDYKLFSRVANNAGTGMDEVLKQFKESGVETVGVREIMVEDLCYDGKVFASDLGEALSALHITSLEELQKIKEFLGENPNPSGHIIATADSNIADLLEDRLASRFQSNQLTMFRTENRTYFYLNTQIKDLMKLGLGFDLDLLDQLKSQGFNLLLLPTHSPGLNAEYLKEYVWKKTSW